jgi:hypothetical protein
MYIRSHAGRPLFSTLPPLVRRGFAAVLAGALVDTAYHVVPLQADAVEWAGLAGHLITLLGMIIVMVGVVGVALRSRHA